MPLSLSVLLHATVIGGALAFGLWPEHFRLQVRWQASEASQPFELRFVEPRPVPTPPDAPPTPAIEPEPATVPPPQSALVTETFAPEADAKPKPEPAIPRPEPTPRWLQRLVVEPPVEPAAPPPAPAAAFVAAVPDDNHNRPPAYPLESRRRNEQGDVAIELQIDAGGAVVEARVLRSSGHLRLDRAALAALRQYRFQPAMRLGVAVPVTIEQTVEFRLGRDGR